jgi:hypothetical protein
MRPALSMAEGAKDRKRKSAMNIVEGVNFAEEPMYLISTQNTPLAQFNEFTRWRRHLVIVKSVHLFWEKIRKNLRISARWY